MEVGIPMPEQLFPVLVGAVESGTEIYVVLAEPRLKLDAPDWSVL